MDSTLSRNMKPTEEDIPQRIQDYIEHHKVGHNSFISCSLRALLTQLWTEHWKKDPKTLWVWLPNSCCCSRASLFQSLTDWMHAKCSYRTSLVDRPSKLMCLWPSKADQDSDISMSSLLMQKKAIKCCLTMPPEVSKLHWGSSTKKSIKHLLQS